MYFKFSQILLILLFTPNIQKTSAIYETHQTQNRIIASNHEAHQACPKNATGLFAYQYSCYQFLNCWKGRGHVQSCAPGTLFNPKRSQCDFSEAVECSAARTDPADDRQQVEAQVACPHAFTGRIPDYFNCSKYIECREGAPAPRTCPTGTQFDVRHNVCGDTRWIKCFNREERALSGINSKLDFDTRISTKCQTKANDCSGGKSGIFAHSTNCAKFIQCANGIKYEQDCASGTLFNAKLSICDFPYNVACQNDNNRQEQSNDCQLEGTKYDQISSANQQTGAVYPSNQPAGENYGSTNQHSYPNHAHDNQFVTPSNQQTNPNYGQSGSVKPPIYPSYTDYVHNNQNTRPNNQLVGNQDIFPSNVNSNPNLNYDQSGSKQPFYPSYNDYVNNNQKTSTNDQHVSSSNQHSNPSNGNYETNLNYGQSGYNKQHIYPSYDSNHQINPSYKPLGLRTHETTPNYDQSGQTYPSYNDHAHRNEKTNPSNQNNYSGGQIINQQKINSNFGQSGGGKQPSYPDYDDHAHGNHQTNPSNGQFDYNTGYFTNSNNYAQTSSSHHQTHYETSNKRQETPKWPPPFPSTDTNADYVYDDDDYTLHASKSSSCQFFCTSTICLSSNQVCDGVVNCPNRKDEMNCTNYVENFTKFANNRLECRETKRFNRTSVENCAFRCITTKNCKSFTHQSGICSLNNQTKENAPLITMKHSNYFEMNKNLMLQHSECDLKCPNGKCLQKSQKCNGYNDCADRSDEKNCSAADFGYKITLVGSQPHIGAVQVAAFGKTGFICDDGFTMTSATVACRELGFSGAISMRTSSKQHFGPTFYMMDDVACAGGEPSLINCDFSGWGQHNCQPNEMVELHCQPTHSKTQCPHEYFQCASTVHNECLPIGFVCDGIDDCGDGSDESGSICDAKFEIRLANGTDKAGRVEIKHNGIWGTICDDDFNENTAKVICHQLGHVGNAEYYKNARYGPGSGPIWLDQVVCNGNERTLTECLKSEWAVHNCDHHEDVSIQCGLSSSTSRKIERHAAVSYAPAVQCGLRADAVFTMDDSIHQRVVAGSQVPRGSYPWQAALKLRVAGSRKLVHWCGAVVIAPNFVLTAAHCLVGYPKSVYVIVAGDYDVNVDEGTEQVVEIDDFRMHEEFRKGHKMANDIAVVQLKTALRVEAGGAVQAICLPDGDVVYAGGLNCTISGFGTTEHGRGGAVSELRAGWVELQAEEVCKMPHVYGNELKKGMFCAGSLEGGVDACEGDSGGPLACLKNGYFTLFGVISWGRRCGEANKPGVYANVAHYKDWIVNTIEDFEKK